MVKIGDRLRYLKANQAVYARWKDIPEWTHEQAAFLLAGYHPHPFELVNDYSQADIDAQMEVAVFDDVTSQLKDGPYTPEKWIHFALQRGLPIPKPLAIFFPNGRGVIQRCDDLERELLSSRAETAALQKTKHDAAVVERPIATTERNTLLTIIAAICTHSDIKYDERGAATQIANMSEELGAPVTDDTIRKVLTQIPDSLVTRKK